MKKATEQIESTAEAVAIGILSEDADERSYSLQFAGDLLRTQDAERLKQVLVNTLQQETDPHRASGLIWALGKSCDPQLIQNYRDFLRKFTGDVPAASEGLYQALIALDNCGEPVFGMMRGDVVLRASSTWRKICGRL